MKKTVLKLTSILFIITGCYVEDASLKNMGETSLVPGAEKKELNPNVSQSCEEINGKRYCSMLIKSIDQEDGDVNSLFISNVLADGDITPMQIGRQYIESVPVDYRAVLSFATNNIPANVQIENIYLQAAFELISYNQSIPAETLYASILENLVLDFNTLTGFGGSPVLTGLDMYGYFTNRVPIGNLDYPVIPQEFLNPYGKTQIRVGFVTNLYDVYYHLTGHVLFHENDRPRLEITWSEDL